MVMPIKILFQIQYKYHNLFSVKVTATIACLGIGKQHARGIGENKSKT